MRGNVSLIIGAKNSRMDTFLSVKFQNLCSENNYYKRRNSKIKSGDLKREMQTNFVFIKILKKKI